MKKMTTLYKKDPNDLGRVIDEIDPENKWVIEIGFPTRKFDGTACAIIGGELHKRYDCKIDINAGKYKKPIPDGAIPCQAADKLSGHHPHWVLCNRGNPAERWHWEAFDYHGLDNLEDGTYELCGERVQGNPESLQGHHLIRHGEEVLSLKDFSFNGIREYLLITGIEGIVFHNNEDDRMCKIRKGDFGMKR